MSLKCRQIRRCLAEEVVAELKPELRSEIISHIANCSTCAEAFRAALLFDSALSATFEAVPNVLGDHKQPLRLFGNGPKWILLAGGLVASAMAGYVAGEFDLSPPFQVALAHEQYNDLRKDDVVVDRNIPGFETGPFGAWSFERGTTSEWQFPALKSGNRAIIDSTVHRSGSSSLRLSHEPGGGEARLNVELPIPRNTHIAIVAWVYSPKGGSTKGKWLSVGGLLKPMDPEAAEPQGVSQDVVAPTGTWQQIALHFNAVADYKALELSLSTAAGDAENVFTNWYSWVDDVQLVLKLRATTEPAMIEKNHIIQTFELPRDYLAENIEWSTVELIDKNYKTFRPVTNPQRKIRDNRVILTFTSVAAASALSGKNPDDPSAPLQGLIRGRVRYGRFLVPFEAGVSVLQR